MSVQHLLFWTKAQIQKNGSADPSKSTFDRHLGHAKNCHA